ncbi:MAG TPA: asparaginase [Gaiellaceae bacterium]|nr:asparaginase [Gaiellaceae bacterium]
MPALHVVVRRGPVEESRHAVHAVAVQDGAVVAEAGDPGVVTYLRSAAKPFQALPLVRARDDLTPAEIAIACASHRALPAQLEAARSLLARAEATEDDLELGPEPTKLEHNCSGKHAGMLALCRARSWDIAGYRLPEHPVQQACAEELLAAAGAPPAEVPTAADGCGVVTFALPLERMALAFSRLREREGGPEVIAAMRAHPELIRGPRAADTVLMQALDGWAAKGGAEGVLCAAGPDGLAVALKVADGSGRAVAPALAAFVARLGHELPSLAASPLVNSRGDVVGEIVAEAA